MPVGNSNVMGSYLSGKYFLL